MDAFHCAFGSVYIILIVLSTPVYLRLIYIFLKFKQYRSLQCYQIMAQLGIVQCLMGPGWALTGLAAILGYDLFYMATFMVKVTASCLRVETGLTLVLALDRVKIVCKVNYPGILLKMLMVLVWLVGITQCAFLISPLAEMYADGEAMTPRYDYTFVWTATLQKVSYLYSFSLSIAIFVLYIFMVAYLVREQRKMLHVTANFKQKWIFNQALIRFAVDALTTILFHFGPNFLPASKWITVAMIVGYIMNNIMLPPFLYLYLNRSLRQKAVGREATSVFQVSTRSFQGEDGRRKSCRK